MRRMVCAIMAAAFWCYLSGASLTAEPSVYVDISQMDRYTQSMDVINADDVIGFETNWHMGMFLTSPGSVTSPRIEFICDAPQINNWYPTPTSLPDPNTVIWDYPGQSLNYGQSIHLSNNEGLDWHAPIFALSRSVDDPVLDSNAESLTVTATLRFTEPLPAGVNSLGLRIGTQDWDQEIIDESLTDQSDVAGWSINPGGWWNIDPADIIVGFEYTFTAQIWCAKNPAYLGTTYYHKPEVSLLFSERTELEDRFGSQTSILHPQQRVAVFRVEENVLWQRNFSRQRRDVSLRYLTIPVDTTGLRVNNLLIHYGREYEGDGDFRGYGFGVEVDGDNVVSGWMRTPTGRLWPLEIDVQDDEMGFWPGDGFIEPNDLAELGLVAGDYEFTFEDHLGHSLTTTVNDVPLIVPEQHPHLVHPAHGSEGLGTQQLFLWEPAVDPNVNAIVLFLENTDETYRREIWDIPAASVSYPVDDLPEQNGMESQILFARFQEGVTPQAVTWTAVGYTLHESYFSTACAPGDFNCDREVNLADFARLASCWLSEAGDPRWDPACQLRPSYDAVIDMPDLMEFVNRWLGHDSR